MILYSKLYIVVQLFMFRKIASNYIFLFIAITTFSAIFRITNLDLIEFKSDEGINLFLATRPFFGHPFPPGATVSSIGILNPPILNYLLLPPLFISLNPMFVSFYIGLINSLSIGLLFLIIRRFYNVWIALIATLLMAFSPWAILFSRKIWAQDFIIPLFIPLFYSLHKIVIDKKQFYWLPFTVFALFLIQLHQATIFFIFLLVIFLLLQKIKFNLKYILFGILIGILPLIPYLGYQISNNCPDCYALISANKRLINNNPFILFLRLLQITNSGNFYNVIGNDIIVFATQFSLVYKARAIFYLEYLLLPASMIFFFIKFKNLRFLALSVIALPILYFLLKIEPFIHYFIIAIPLLFLFLSSFIYYFSKINIYFKLIGISVIFLLIVISVAFNFVFLSILSKNGSLQGNYGISFKESDKQTKKIFDNYKNDKYYQEMILSSYVPKSLMLGYLPIAKMLYKRQDTEKILTTLDERLKKVPVDTLVENRLLAYYTPLLGDSKSILILREKAQKNSDYEKIYKIAFSDYLQKRYLKSFDNKSFGIAFEYPEHWKAEVNKNGEIEVQDEKYILTIKRIDRMNELKYKNLKDIALNNIKRKECVTQDKKWCGVILEPLEIDNIIFEIKYMNYLNNPVYFKDSEITFITKVIDDILHSLRAN